MADKLMFPIGFDLEEGVKQVQKEWDSKYQKKISKAISDKPIEVNLKINATGLDKDLKHINELASKLKKTIKELSQSQREYDKARKVSAQADQAEMRAKRENIRLGIEEATQTDAIRQKKANAALAEQRLANAKVNGTNQTRMQNAEYGKQSRLLANIMAKMVAYASIHQALNIARRIRETTAEFELQRVALGALIQDTYKANAIFEQIKVQAVRSPFEVKDLVTYTKQLAAYGTKADELMGTMNMLADISAGLGVDMNRIILAYGQVQAASVLKGTELRQFTEAGIPMVEMLAQYYSTLRDEVVSTAEVFKMISAKEVPFQAVKDILEDLTSEGGRFYEMQATQAKTLAGQWNNMKDALSIMFDEMGRTETVRALFEGLIDVVKWLALNWERVWKAVKTVGYVYGGLKVAASITKLLSFETLSYAKASRLAKIRAAEYNAATLKGNGLAVINAARLKMQTHAMRKYAAATNFATKAVWKLWAAMLANPVTAIVSLVAAMAGLALWAGKSKDEMDAFHDKMRDAVRDSVEHTVLLSNRFKQLAEEVVKSADGSEKQQKALRRLKQQFGEMFPDYQLTVEYLRQMHEEASGTATAFDSMVEHIKAFSGEKMRQQFIENYNQKLQEQFSNVFSRMTDGLGKNWSELLGVVLNEGLEVNGDEMAQKVLKAWEKSWGSEIPYVSENTSLTPTMGSRFITKYLTQQDSLNEMLGKLTTTDKDFREQYHLNDLREILQLVQAFANAQATINGIMKDFDYLDPEMAAINKEVSKFETKLEEIRNEATGETLLDKNFAIERGMYSAMWNAVKAITQEDNEVVKAIMDDYTSGVRLEEIFSKYAIGAKEADGLSKIFEHKPVFTDSWRQALEDLTGYIDEGNKKVTVYSSDQIKAFSSLPNALEDVAKKYKELAKEGKVLARIKSSGGISDPEEIEQLNTQIDKTKHKLEALYSFLARYGMLDLIDDEDTKEWITLIKNQTKFMEEYKKGYDDLRKTKGIGQALAEDKNIRRAQGITLGINVDTLNAPKENLEKWYEQTVAAIQEKIADLGGEEWTGIGVEAILSKDTRSKTIKALQQLLQEILTAQGKFNTDEAVKTDEKILKNITQKLSRTKAASEFFDRMLGLTGDKELTASLTMSVYGEGGDQLGAELAKQTAEEFKQTYKDISFSKDAISEDGLFNWTQIEKEAKAHANSIGETVNEDLQKAIEKGKQDQAKRIESFVKELEAAKTYGEKLVKLHQQTQQRIKDINETVTDENAKGELTKKANKLYAKKVSELQYEAFKDSPMYVSMFEKLDATSGAMLRNMRQYMTDLQDSWNNLDPTQLKELQSRLNKIDEQLASRNPFESIVSGLKEYHELSKGGNSRAQDEMALFNATKARMEAEKEYQEAVQSKASIEVLNKLKEKLDGCVAVEKSAAKQMQQWDDAIQKAVNGINNLSKVFDVIKAVTKAINDMSAALGGFGDAADDEFWNTILGGVDKFLEGTLSAATGVGQILAGDIFGGVTSMISGISNLATSLVDWIYADRIKDANKEIEYQADILDNLSYAYERLEKAQEKAFGSEYIDVYHQKLANLQAQYDAYRKQLDAEQSKGKKADDAKINEYEDSMKKTADAIKDMQTQLSEHLLGTDLASAARDFASAWIDAYKDFSSTTDAMKDKFQDMIQNMIVESFAAKVMESALDPIFTKIDEMSKDGVLDMNEAAQVAGLAQTAIGNIDVGMNNLMAALQAAGISVRGMGGDLTGISRDIATASEESILGLAAGINTQNYYISQVPAKMDIIIGLLRGEGAMAQGSTVTLQDLVTLQNQHLSYLPTIAQHTADTVAQCQRAADACETMARQLGSVIKPQGAEAAYRVATILYNK